MRDRAGWWLRAGLAAGLAAVGLSALVVVWLNAELRALTSSYAYEFKVIFLDLSGLAAVVAGVGALGVAGAWMSVSRELQRFGPRG